MTIFTAYNLTTDQSSICQQLCNGLIGYSLLGLFVFVYHIRVSSPSFLVSSQSLIVIITSWFSILLDQIRTRRILREKADCKQSKKVPVLLATQVVKKLMY